MEVRYTTLSTFVCVLEFSKVKRALVLFFGFEMPKCALEGSLLILQGTLGQEDWVCQS